MLTDERLAEIEARCNAATPGPWTLMPETCGPDGQGVYEESGLGIICEVGDPYPRGGNHPQENMEFIAAARADVPDLLAEEKRLRAEMARDYPTIESDEVLHFEPVSRYIVRGRVASVTWGEMRWVEEEESDAN